MKSTIDSIPLKPGMKFEGEFRIRGVQERTDQHARPFVSFTITDITGEFPAYCWQTTNRWCLKEFDAVRLEGRLRERNRRWLTDILDISPFWAEIDDPEDAIQLLPWAACPNREALARLRLAANEICTAEMRGFINSVFADTDIVLPFVSTSASKDHHHQGSGGLLLHAVECMEWILKLEPTPSANRDLALGGALLHDVGKVTTYKRAAHGPVDRYLIHHDARTLELLATPLKQLESQWADGATALRYIWTWRNTYRRPQYPALLEAEIVHAADRWSAIGDVHDLAFSGAADWKRFTNFGARDHDGKVHGPTTLCWRPNPPKSVSGT